MKMIIRHFIFAAAALSVIFSCTKPEAETGNENIELDSAGTLVVEVASTTSTTASFNCELTKHPDAGKSFRAGIMYSTSQRFTSSSAKRVVIENPVNGTHTLSIEGLTFSTRYYYASYVYHHGEYEISEVTSFTTADVEIESEIVDCQHDKVTIGGKVHLDENTIGKVRAGLLFSNTIDFDEASTLDSDLKLDEEGRFSMQVTGLDAGTTYYYACYVSQGTRRVVSEAEWFVTLDPYSEAFDELDVNAATDLSAGESSNSYIVTGPGLYKFKTVKGNSDESVGEVAMVNVLWETFGTMEAPSACELITTTFYKDGYAIFRVPEDYKQGNALVVAKNARGENIWSWHIWLLSEVPSGIEYANGAGVMMDRNLGALSMQKGDPKGFGLLYQWGRKDPLPGAATKEGTSMAATTAKIYVAVSTPDVGTIDYAVKNPTTMILKAASSSSDWLFTPEAHDSEDARWQSVKTKYDPCPPGWRVPDGGPDGIWAKAGLPNGATRYIDEDGKYTTDTPVLFPYPESDRNLAGINIPAQYTGVDTWYPAAGSISSLDATFVYAGVDGNYWSVTPCGPNDVYGFNFFYYMNNEGYVYNSARLIRSDAASVRCCREN